MGQHHCGISYNHRFVFQMFLSVRHFPCSYFCIRGSFCAVKYVMYMYLSVVIIIFVHHFVSAFYLTCIQWCSDWTLSF